jgi:hypothetical protein
MQCPRLSECEFERDVVVNEWLAKVVHWVSLMANVDRTWPARFHLKMTDITQHSHSGFVSCYATGPTIYLTKYVKIVKAVSQASSL